MGNNILEGTTPGPWFVSKQKARRVTNAHGVVICNAVLRNQGTAKGGIKHGAKDVLEAEANARLIAAASSLAAENERLRKALQRCGEIVERNLYRQHEKIEDVPKIVRAALSTEETRNVG